MKYTFLTFFLLSIALVNSNTSFGKKDTTVFYCTIDLEKTKKKMASYYVKVFKNQDGTIGVKQFFSGGGIYMTGSFKSADLDIKIGHFVYYDQNGLKVKEGGYNNGQKISLWRHYGKNQKVIEEGEYVKDQKFGAWNYFTSEGKKSALIEYSKGVYQGRYMQWHNDTLTLLGRYDNNQKTGEWKSWYKNRKLDYQGKYVSGKREGEWKFYHKSGKIAAIETYENGEPLKAEWFDEEGKTVEPNDPLEKEPEFPGGEIAMAKFIAENFKYPEYSREMGEQGTVYVQFNINYYGSISDVNVVKGVSPALDKESLRVIKLFEKWTPGIDHNRNNPLLYTIPIRAKLG